MQGWEQNPPLPGLSFGHVLAVDHVCVGCLLIVREKIRAVTSSYVPFIARWRAE